MVRVLWVRRAHAGSFVPYVEAFVERASVSSNGRRDGLHDFFENSFCATSASLNLNPRPQMEFRLRDADVAPKVRAQAGVMELMTQE